MEQEWIKNLKVGDEVIVRSGGHYPFRHIEKVEKVNKTTVSVDGILYTLEGEERGQRYGRARIFEATDQLRKEVEEEMTRRILCRGLYHLRWETLSTEKLVAIDRIIKESK